MAKIRVAPADASTATEQMVLTEISVAHKLIDAAQRTRDEQKAQRFLSLAGAAFSELSLHSAETHRSAADLPHVQQALTALETRLADMRTAFSKALSS